MDAPTRTQPDKALRLARIIQAGALALGAYEAYVKALADNVTRAEVRDAYNSFLRADHAVTEAQERKGYEPGDHVRLNAPGPWRGATGTLEKEPLGDDRYPWRLVFDEPQPTDLMPDGFAKSCVTSLDQIADIAA